MADATAAVVASIVLAVLLCGCVLKACMGVCNGTQRPMRRSGPPPEGDPRFPFFMSEHTGLWVYRRVWRPAADVEPRAVIVFGHGFGEYADRHAAAAQEFADNGFVFWAWDLEGHGRSDGDRGMLKDSTMDGFISDAEQAVRLASEQFPGLPVFVMAHSMGGLIAVHMGSRLAAKHDAGAAPWADRIAGFVLTSPAIAADPKIATPVAVAATRLLGGLFPRLAVATLDPDDLTNNPLVNEQARCDAGMSGTLHARIALAGLSATAQVPEAARGFTWPVLVLQDRDDKTTVPEAGEAFVGMAASADKAAVMLAGHKHELLIADGYTAVIHDNIIPWMAARGAAATAAASQPSADATAAGDTLAGSLDAAADPAAVAPALADAAVDAPLV